MSSINTLHSAFESSGFDPGDFAVTVDPGPALGDQPLAPVAEVRRRGTGLVRLYVLDKPRAAAAKLAGDLTLGLFGRR